MKKLLTLLVTLFVAAFLASSALASSRGILPGSHGPSVRGLQKKLTSLGYLPSGSVDGYYASATTFAVEAFQKQESLSRDGVAGPQTLKALQAASAPSPRYKGAGNHVEINIAKQLLYLVSDGLAARTIAISSAGPGHYTPTGSYKIYRKETMSWSIPYSSWMPYASYFTGGFAIHGYPDVPVYPASHGCVRVPESFMKEVYSFDSYGTPVIIY